MGLRIGISDFWHHLGFRISLFSIIFEFIKGKMLRIIVLVKKFDLREKVTKVDEEVSWF